MPRNLADVANDGRVVIMSALGFASGLLVSFSHALEGVWREMSVGYVFGIVIAVYLFRLGLARPLKAVAFAALATLSWMAAERVAIAIFGRLPGEDVFFTLKGLIAGVAGGLLGAFLLMLAGALLFSFYRRPGLGVATVVTGGVAGALLTLIDLADSTLVLFPPWQAAIGFCLALGLPKGCTGGGT